MPQTCSGSIISPCRVRSQRGPIALLVGLALSVGVSLGAQAATTWTVCTSGCDHTSIKSAIAAATTLDGDTLAIAAGTYTEPGITMNKSLTLQGEDAATTIVQAAESPNMATTRVFTIWRGVTVTLQNVTIRYGHVTNGYGGGLLNYGTLTLTSGTVRGNTAREGAGLSNGFDTLPLTNSIVASQSDGGDCSNDAGAPSPSQGYNRDSDDSCQLTAPTDRPGGDRRLGHLQDNGGPTLTHALLPGSPALDAIPWGTNGCGMTLYSDQRGQARPQPAGGACDIGAYEVAVAGQALGG